MKTLQRLASGVIQKIREKRDRKTVLRKASEKFRETLTFTEIYVEVVTTNATMASPVVESQLAAEWSSVACTFAPWNSRMSDFCLALSRFWDRDAGRVPHTASAVREFLDRFAHLRQAGLN